jgi:HopA1 effector protein family
VKPVAEPAGSWAVDRAPGHASRATRDVLGSVVDGLSITDVDVRWFGDRWVKRVPAGDGDDVAALSAIVAGLLYSHVYSVSRPMLRRELEGLVRATVSRSLGPMLAAANPGHGRREAGWECVRVLPDAGVVIVRKRGLQVMAEAVRVRAADLGSVRTGAPLVVDTPSGSMNRSAGYYVAHSDADLDYGAPLARLYVDVSPDGAASVLRQVCTALNRCGLAFDFKVASDAAHFHRCDVAVLYAPRAAVANVWDAVRPVLAANAAMLRPPVPAWTRAIIPGVGAADDPANGTSFGMDRCHAVALGLVRAASAPRDERLAAVTAAFVEQGIDPVSPHLTLGADDPYAGLA